MKTWGRGSEPGRGAGTASRTSVPAPERTQARKGLPEGAEGAQSTRRDGAAEAAAPLTAAADVLSSPGTPLPAGTRAFMEARFGHNFGHVRIHADEGAAVAARH